MTQPEPEHLMDRRGRGEAAFREGDSMIVVDPTDRESMEIRRLAREAAKEIVDEARENIKKAVKEARESGT